MKKKSMDNLLLKISVAGFGLMSLSFVLMPVEAVGLFPGVLFWTGLLTGSMTQVVLELRRRAFFKRYRINRKKMQKPQCGVFTFASNPAAKKIDLIAAVSLVVTILFLLITNGVGIVCYWCIGITAFAFCMHCILNGRNYFHLKNKSKIQQLLESKKENQSKKGEAKT